MSIVYQWHTKVHAMHFNCHPLGRAHFSTLFPSLLKNYLSSFVLHVIFWLLWCIWLCEITSPNPPNGAFRPRSLILKFEGTSVLLISFFWWAPSIDPKAVLTGCKNMGTLPTCPVRVHIPVVHRHDTIMIRAWLFFAWWLVAFFKDGGVDQLDTSSIAFSDNPVLSIIYMLNNSSWFSMSKELGDFHIHSKSYG